MSEQTPSQAEGTPDEEEPTTASRSGARPTAPRTTPSQAEGDDDEEVTDTP
ncbi:hypothetical protein ABZX62_13375 [Streptomyces flavidovirens]|uniref:Uncharacterized protein n=1 Tax=Streptomyces flavidovirens TaxID=67298 RepID=A0ABW6RK77_9ACTN